MDKWLALVTLWICVTGSIGMVLAQLDDPWRYIRLALRLSGPPLLLVVCEEAVRTGRTPGSRRTSLTFASVVWVAAVGTLIYFEGGTIVELQLPFFDNTQVGVTAWMAMLAVCFFSALLTVVPALTRRVNPGFAGVAATIILFSESWAAVDPRWGSGALSVSENLTYRSLLTFALAIIGLAKAHSDGLLWLMSGAATDPPDDLKPKKKPTKKIEPASKPKRKAKKEPPEEEDEPEDVEPPEPDDEPPEKPAKTEKVEKADKGKKTKNAESSKGSSGSKGKKSKSKKKKGGKK